MTHIIVVGAGIAGLSAAWRLTQAGCTVTVLEAADSPGGRIRSLRFHGRDMECGAQFPSSGYRYVLPLFDETGLRARLHPTSPWASLQRRHDFHRVHGQRPWTLASSGLLSWRESWHLAKGGSRLAWQARGRDPSCYADFAAFDDADAEDWCLSAIGRAATDHVIEPMVHGFYFHRLSGSSRALLAALSAFGSAATLAVDGGWQSLPKAMASQLDVRYGAQVEAIEETNGGVRVCANGEWIAAEGVILAVPAHVAHELLAQPTRAEQGVLGANYASSVHVALGLAHGWQPPANFRRVYGVLCAPVDGGRIAALTLESGREGAADPGAGDVMSVMLGHQGANALLPHTDDVLVRTVLDELNACLPGVHRSVVAVHVQRWPAAEPLSPVGRARAIAHYRHNLAPERRIVLAGDYLGSPWTDGAAETGIWAARHLLARSTTACPNLSISARRRSSFPA